LNYKQDIRHRQRVQIDTNTPNWIQVQPIHIFSRT